MATCPAGHESTDLEFCDVCGREMNADPSAAPQPKPEPAAASVGACPACGAPLDGRFCEACGHDSLAAPPVSAAPDPQPAPVVVQAQAWTATVSADRAYYNTVMAIGGPDAASITFPQFCPDRYFPLRSKQITIGRRSASRGTSPDIDLTGPPEDPGVSHQHAMLLIGSDGNLSIVDLGSSNGTTINEATAPLPANVPHPLSAGDRVHVGAWTTITVNSDR